jgi:hypothetical protein
MPTGDFPDPPGKVWTDAHGWVDAPAGPMFAERPMGCICPPTSEQTCEAPMCPRRNPFKGMLDNLKSK